MCVRIDFKDEQAKVGLEKLVSVSEYGKQFFSIHVVVLYMDYL